MALQRISLVVKVSHPHIDVLFSGTQTSCKEVSPPVQTVSQHSNNVGNASGGALVQQGHISAGVVTVQHQQNNNNKGESGVVGIRRGKSNSESKAQAARNKHKNCQNKEKHGGTRTALRSESSSASATQNNSSQSQINGQKDIRNFSADTNSEMLQKLGNKCKLEHQQQQQQQQQSQQQQQQTSKTSKLVQQSQSHEVKVNGVLQNGERRHSDCETDHQREGSTPASTISSTEDSNLNHQVEHLAESSEENNGAVLLGELFIIVLIFICSYFLRYEWYSHKIAQGTFRRDKISRRDRLRCDKHNSADRIFMIKVYANLTICTQLLKRILKHVKTIKGLSLLNSSYNQMPIRII